MFLLKTIKKKQNALATQEEISLLLNSDCTNRYQGLLKLLMRFKKERKPIYLDDIKNLKTADNETFSILAYSFKELVSEGSREWKQLGYINLDNKVCELCGNTRLEYNFRIKNIKNEKELIVGSSCIDKFPKMDSNGISTNEEMRKAKVIERINAFNNQYENVEDLMESWRRYYIEFPALLPKYIDDNFNKLFKDSMDFYNNFINDKIALKRLDEFNIYIEEFHKMKNESELFYSLNKNNKFLCDRKIIEWLNNKNYRNLRQQIINNDGLINKDIAKNIYTIHFINRFKTKLNDYFNVNEFVLKDLNEYSISITYKSIEGIEVDLELGLREFMSKFSNLFFRNEGTNKINYIIEEFKISWNEDNLSNFIYLLNSRMKKTRYYFKLVYKEGRLTNFIKVERDKNYFVELDGTVFIKNIKLNLNKDIKESSNNINKLLASVSSWKNKKEEKEKYNRDEILEAMRN